jgi:DedD protein
VERHVKERIVGAAIIVALGVWLIPMVLDGPDDATDAIQGADTEILPAASNTAPLRTETVELDPAPAEREPADRDAVSEAEPVALVPPSPETGSSASHEAAGPPERTETAAAEPPAAEPPAARSPVASAPAPAAGGWMVQLGAFGDIDNARQLASRISTYGYSAHVTEFRSGGETMHRVRVGGFATENQADAAASSLSAHGFPGRVIAPE